MGKRETVRDLVRALKKVKELREIIENNGLEHDGYDCSEWLDDCRDTLELRMDDLETALEDYKDNLEDAKRD